jgi:ssDNA-binding Zn-finger/Zn-ribbon topoisomerase 1
MTKNSIPRYLILILSMFNKGSGSIDEYNNAKKFLPKNMPLEDYRQAIDIIGEYIGIEKCKNIAYKEYLHSDYWLSLKAQAIRNAGYRCEQCGSMVKLNVHHGSYERLGNEQPEDLQVLCHKCHKAKHGVKKHDTDANKAIGEIEELKRRLTNE